MRSYRHAIVGGGAAGLALAHRLAHRGESIVLIEPGEPAADPRQLAAWFERPEALQPVAQRTFHEVGCATPEGAVVLAAPGWSYQIVRMADWRTTLEAQLTALPHVQLLRARVDAVTDGHDAATLRVGGDWLRATWVYDARWSPERRVPGAQTTLRQAVRTVAVEVDHDAFDAERPVWMDLRHPDGRGLSFGHLIPDGPRKALVDRVDIHAHPLAGDPEAWIRGPLGLPHARVTPVLRGTIPMTDGRFPRRLGRRVLRIGDAGGRVRPTSGYGLPRILRDADAIVASLEHAGHPFDLPEDGPLVRWLDAVMLRALAQQPGASPAWFASLLHQVPPSSLLRFLDDQPTLADVMALGAALPKRPFLLAASTLAILPSDLRTAPRPPRLPPSLDARGDVDAQQERAAWVPRRLPRPWARAAALGALAVAAGLASRALWRGLTRQQG